MASSNNCSKRTRDLGEGESDSSHLPNTRRRLLSPPSPDSDLTTEAESHGQPEIVQPTTTTFNGGATQRSNVVVAEGRSTEPKPFGDPEAIQMPSDTEIDTFLKVTEKLQKQFADKYNFDVKNGVPMEGRFEWIPIDQDWP